MSHGKLTVKTGREFQECKITAIKSISFFLQCQSSYLHNYFNLQVCQSIWWHHPLIPSVSHFQFQLFYHKMSGMKIAWYVLRVKNMHCRSPSDLWGPIVFNLFGIQELLQLHNYFNIQVCVSLRCHLHHPIPLFTSYSCICIKNCHQ